MARLKVSFTTPDRALVRGGEYDAVTAPSVMGQVTILPEHRPLLAQLEAGPVLLRNGGTIESFAVSGGFIEVANDAVTILADTAEKRAEIDTSRAQAAVKDAEAKLKTLNATEDEYAQQMARAKRNRVRQEVAATSQI
jgi:F-type H+-transporting ATPase subunit epsilon